MAARMPSRLLCRQLRSHVSCRSFKSSSSCPSAHNFLMPAMSPTMTEGNIASWKVKEGDSFSVGDVLLEIETDKASMDVEAQDDGIMAKIFAQDGTKAIAVGTRIAVLADEGDDISSLEIPPDDSKAAPKVPEEASKEESSSKEEPPAPETKAEAPSRPKASSPAGPGQNENYPLYPSVIALIHENHIPDSEVSKIPATGPNNRLLKGDVLAYLGSIEADYSSKESKRLKEKAHLDLSNIKVLPPPEKKPVAAPTADSAVQTEAPETVVSLPISLSEVLKVQKRIQDSLGVSMPLSTFLARAVDIANDDLPVPKGAKPTADDLFNAILGLDTVTTTSRAAYIPQITALPLPASASRLSVLPRPPIKQPDIIDILTGKAAATRKATPALLPGTIAAGGSAGAVNLFTVTVPRGEEMRARTFLERMKTILQVEPGRLVL